MDIECIIDGITIDSHLRYNSNTTGQGCKMSFSTRQVSSREKKKFRFVSSRFRSLLS